jgi:hypothetical protein
MNPQPVGTPIRDEPDGQAVKIIPPKSYNGHNLKRLKSYQKLRRHYKLENHKEIFIRDLSAILKEFPISEHSLDHDLLIEILNIAEQYFIYGDKKLRNEAKTESVATLMMPYFLNNNDLLNKTIDTLWYKVNKSNIFRRCYKRIINFFCSVEKE